MSDDLSSAPLIRIVCAAIQNPKNHKHVYCGVRHRFIREQFGVSILGWIEGFKTNQDEFVDRQQAWKIAVRAEQIRPHPAQRPGILHSEDLY